MTTGWIHGLRLPTVRQTWVRAQLITWFAYVSTLKGVLMALGNLVSGSPLNLYPTHLKELDISLSPVYNYLCKDLQVFLEKDLVNHYSTYSFDVSIPSHMGIQLLVQSVGPGSEN